jgi:hypothetical protein
MGDTNFLLSLLSLLLGVLGVLAVRNILNKNHSADFCPGWDAEPRIV